VRPVSASGSSGIQSARSASGGDVAPRIAATTSGDRSSARGAANGSSAPFTISWVLARFAHAAVIWATTAW
jgi:hypothetical protein